MKKFIFTTLFLIFNSLIICNATPINASATAEFKKAEASFKAKDLAGAEKHLLATLVLEPDNAYYRYVLGKVQYKLGEFIKSRNNLEIVSRSRPSPDKGEKYNKKLKKCKKKIKRLQSQFNKIGLENFDAYQKHKNSPQKLKLAVTLFKAFKLNPPLRYRNMKLLNWVIKVYEHALKKSFDGKEWLKEPMLQLAFLYEITNKKDKAADIYMRALDYVANANEEFVITYKFDYLNRSNKEKLLDTIEAGEFTQQDLEDLIGSESKKITEEDRNKIKDMLKDAQSKLENASTDEEREAVLEDIKATLIEKQKNGELPGSEELKKKLKAQGKTMEQYMKEKGL